MSERKVYCILDTANWAVRTVVDNISAYVKNTEIIVKVKLRLPVKRTIHLAAFPEFYRERKNLKFYKALGNRIIATCFHIVDGNPDYDSIREYDSYVDVWHTSCEITKRKMVNWGIEESKIVVIPIPVNTEVFHDRVETEEVEKLKREMQIPEDAVVIGSFQKDGNGWGDGLEPKLIKGPDVFCDVVEKLATTHKIFVVLSGPARGYVKARLDKAGIPYYHVFYDEPKNVSALYKVIDMYIMASREEGGPMSVLESMASGVPIIATRVGQAPDIIEDRVNGLLCDIEDVNGLVKAAESIIVDSEFRDKIVANGINTAPLYSAEAVAKEYEEKMYKAGM